MGVDMIRGGGKLFAGLSGRVIGSGHFGLLNLEDGVQKFSSHYEADLDRGASVLDIRPLLWSGGWPVGGENATDALFWAVTVIDSPRQMDNVRLAICPNAALAIAEALVPNGWGEDAT